MKVCKKNKLKVVEAFDMDGKLRDNEKIIRDDIREKYVEVVDDDDKGTFTLRRLKVYARKELIVMAYISAENSPTGKEMKQSFVLSLRGLE